MNPYYSSSDGHEHFPSLMSRYESTDQCLSEINAPTELGDLQSPLIQSTNMSTKIAQGTSNFSHLFSGQ